MIIRHQNSGMIESNFIINSNYIKQKNFEAYIRARNKRSTVNKLSSLRYEP